MGSKKNHLSQATAFTETIPGGANKAQRNRVATSFSQLHAQKLLGHSTPAVTSAYYASLTDLPELQPSRMGQSS